MPKDRKKFKDRNEENLGYLEDEATQANEGIQDEFYSEEGDAAGPSASPIPYVSNNTAPLNAPDSEKKKR